MTINYNLGSNHSLQTIIIDLISGIYVYITTSQQNILC